jgi:hypothetical protein
MLHMKLDTQEKRGQEHELATLGNGGNILPRRQGIRCDHVAALPERTPRRTAELADERERRIRSRGMVAAGTAAP